MRQSAAVFLALSALLVGHPSRATTPEQASVNDILGNSSELFIRRNNRRESVQIGSVLQRVRDALITSPPNNARALLRFLSSTNEDLNLYAQTNPHPEPAIYYFPCQMQGGNYHIGWGLAGGERRGCETGMTLRSGYPAVAPAAAKQMAQTPAQQIFFCTVASETGSVELTTSTAGDPCPDALEQCQAAGGNCSVTTTGFWWTTDEQLQARLDCANDQIFAATGTGETIASQIESLLQQAPGQSCQLQIYRPQDFGMTPAPDDVVLALGDDEILVHVQDTPQGLQIDVLKGAINVRSGGPTEPRLISKGERYVHSPSGGEVVAFDRAAALTSVDMEVLCAFASYPENNLEVAACREANLIPPPGVPGQPVIAFCDREQGSGGQEGDRRTLQMGTNRGDIELDYEMFTVPDRFQIIYEGREILDTGFISGSDRLSIPFSGQSGRVDVIVTGNEEIGTTRWNYILRCPR